MWELVVSESYHCYLNGAVNIQLTNFGRGEWSVWGCLWICWSVERLQGYSVHTPKANSTEYTEWQRPLSGVNSIMMVKSAQPGVDGGGGARPPPFTIVTITYKVAVRFSRAGRKTPTISSLPLCMYSVANSVSLGSPHNKPQQRTKYDIRISEFTRKD